MTLTLVLGGARSGKSAYALEAAQINAAARCAQLVMLATAEGLDAEMKGRIARHRAERGPAWRTVEAPLDLPESIAALEPAEAAVVDCLTLWVSNLMMREMDVEAGGKALLASLTASRLPIWIVSNEVGLGIVPDNALARKFRDDCGRLHRQIAALADHVVMLVAGLPLTLK